MVTIGTKCGGSALRLGRMAVLCLGIAPVFGAQQSVQVTSGSPSVTLPNRAPWTTIGRSTNPMRWEVRIHGFGADFPAYPSYLVNLGPAGLARGATPNRIQAGFEWNSANTFDVVSNNGPGITGCCAGWNDVLVRVQRDVANQRYTIEACNGAGGACYSSTAEIISYGPPSWVGQPLGICAGGRIAFFRWFSGVVPVGTPIRSTGVVGDLGDWEFEGNLLDLSGNNLALSGGSVSYSATPVYAPVCNAGTQRAFRAGHAAALDGSGSYPVDGGSFLSYVWQLASGPSVVSWSSHSVAQPQIKGLVFGSYVFQLTVTDSSNQSSVCTVKDGAVATDDNDIVITNNSAVDMLMGPMVRYGANPWPWYDTLHKQAADGQNSIMDTYFPAWWDTAGPGTVAVTYGSNAVVGVGTTFTTTFCQGPANPTAVQPGSPVIAIWHPLGSGTGRVMYSVASCTDDTHLTMDYAYGVNMPFSEFPGASGLTYAGDNQYAAIWGWSQANSPGNYYDNVAAYYALYYRSGIDDYLTAARKLADRFWESPMIDRGIRPSGYGFTGRSVSAMGLVLRALDGRPDMWAGQNGSAYGGLHQISNDFMAFLSGWDVANGIYDPREEAYQLAVSSYCALFDTDSAYRSTCKTAIINSFPAVFTPGEHPDGSFPSMFPVNDGSSWATNSTVTLTHGSQTVVGVGTNWSASSFSGSPNIWFFPSTVRVPHDDAAGDPVSYTPTFVDSTHLTLDRPYAGTTGSHGWEIAGITGWAAQPFLQGILAAAFDLAAKAVADVDPATSSLAHRYNVAAANWIKNYGYWPLNKGLYYFAGGMECQPPIADNNYTCTSGEAPGSSRTLSAEGLRGLDAAYAYSQDQSLKAFIDNLYNAMWAKPTTCPAGSTLCVPDGYYIDGMDGGYMIDVPPLASWNGVTPWKWFGMFFGFSAQSAWPGYRVGGVQPMVGEPVYIGANLPGVPGAAAILVSTTDPSGKTYTTSCTALPCAVTVDRRQGDHLMSIQYLSATGAVLASSQVPLIGGQ